MLKAVTLTLLVITMALRTLQDPKQGVKINLDFQLGPTIVLTELHDAASKADGERYFALFAPDAVFLGTDATERWTIEEFKTYAMARFKTGKGWTYMLQPGTRHISFSSTGDIAWFDELLDNAKYGTCRGSGVLRKIDDQWKIAQYNLTFTVPNDAAERVVQTIHEQSQHAAETKPAR